MHTLSTQRAKCGLALIVTLAIIHALGSTPITLLLLLTCWYLLFRPWPRVEVLMFIIASLFFLVQNYMVLKEGGFRFRDQDILLMPYYEPFLWGFYFVTFKRLVAEPGGRSRLDWKAFVGLALTGLCFSLFSADSTQLLIATLCSTGILLLMFHQKHDLAYAVCALMIGFVIELFGVSTGLWSYPEPDILGIPFWFATMWLSVGLLGRRFLVPLAEAVGKMLD